MRAHIYVNTYVCMQLVYLKYTHIPVCTCVCRYRYVRLSARTYMGIWVGKDRAGPLCNSWHLPPVPPPFFLVECRLSRPNIFLAVSVVQPQVGKLSVVGQIRAGIYVRCWRHLPPA